MLGTLTTKNSVVRNNTSIQAKPSHTLRFASLSMPKDHFIKFSANPTESQAPPKTFKTLFKEEFPSLLKFMMVSPFDTLLSLLTPSPLIGTLKGTLQALFVFPIKHFKAIQARSNFNKTEEAKHLNSLLPYRKSIQSDPSSLKKYEQLVQNIINQSNFVESAEGLGKFNPLLLEYCNQHFPEYRKDMKEMTQTLPKSISKAYSLLKNESTKNSLLNKIWKINSKYYKQITLNKLIPNTVPINDKSLKYLTAASIVEGLHNRPEIIHRILNSPRKLTFVIPKKSSIAIGGLNIPGMNTIILDKLAIGGLAVNTGLHEFIHSTTEDDNIPQLTIKDFSSTEKKQFTSIAKTLKEQFIKNDKTFWGKFKIFLTGTTSTGLSNYTFLNDFEFPTTTIQLFMDNPKTLRKTAAGKKLYDFYKKFLQIDPLQNYKDLSK